MRASGNIFPRLPYFLLVLLFQFAFSRGVFATLDCPSGYEVLADAPTIIRRIDRPELSGSRTAIRPPSHLSIASDGPTVIRDRRGVPPSEESDLSQGPALRLRPSSLASTGSYHRGEDDSSQDLRILVLPEQSSLGRNGHAALSKNNIEPLATQALGAAGYTDVKPLGAGGMGSVYSAQDSQGRRRVIKFLHHSDSLRERGLIHEVAIMNRLADLDPRFPRARMLELSTEQGQKLFGFETELIPLRPGSTEAARPLDELLKEPDFLLNHKETAREIQRQYLDLLEKAHSQGIFHLDIKPHNILVSYDDNGKPLVHLIDWGLSHQNQGEKALASPYVAQGLIYGTPGYFPIERMTGSPPRPYDDVYATRMVDWRLRQSLTAAPDHFVIRYAYSSDSSDSGSKSPSSGGDSSGFKNTVKEPAFALDLTGDLTERIVAMAEWSTVPKTIRERQQLIEQARTVEPREFFREHGKRLLRLDPPKEAIGGVYRYRLAEEVLASSVLIDQLDTTKGLQLSVKDIETIARSAAVIQLNTNLYKKSPRNLGLFGPHADYHYDRLAKRIDELAARGVMKPWRFYYDEEANLRPTLREVSIGQ